MSESYQRSESTARVVTTTPSFTVVRRGFDQAQVLSYFTSLNNTIRELVSEKESLVHKVDELSEELRNPTLDIDRMTDAFGRQASEILRSAHDAATAIRQRAEAAAKEVSSRAQREAEEIESRAQLAAESQLSDAAGMAREVVEGARSQAQEILQMAERGAASIVDRAKAEGRAIILRARESRAKVFEETQLKIAEMELEIERLRSAKDVLVKLVKSAGALIGEAGDLLEVPEGSGGAGKEAMIGREGVVAAEAESEDDVLVDDDSTTRRQEVSDEEVSHLQNEADGPDQDQSAHGGATHPWDNDTTSEPDALDWEPDDEDEEAQADLQALDPLAKVDETEDLMGREVSPGVPSPTEVSLDDRSIRVDQLDTFERNVSREFTRDVVEVDLAIPVDEDVQTESGPSSVRDEPAEVFDDEPLLQDLEEEARRGIREDFDERLDRLDHLFGRLKSQREQKRHEAEQILGGGVPVAEDAVDSDQPVASEVPEVPLTPTPVSAVPSRDQQVLAALTSALGGATSRSGVQTKKPDIEVLDAEDSSSRAPEVEATKAEREPPTEGSRFEHLFRRRDSAIAHVELTLTRRLKRILQDDQSAILDALRQGGVDLAYRSAADLVATPARNVSTIVSNLVEAVQAGIDFGRSFVTDEDYRGELSASDLANATSHAESLSRALDELSVGRIADMRDTLERADESAQIALIGAVFREVRGSKVDELVGDYLNACFASGVRSVDGATGHRWITFDIGGNCADCDDNALAGDNPPSEAFPTGHRTPPVHAGCRCLIVPVFA
ncbi:MAG: hypothetical protein ACP5PJ_04810 [Acidimicrobiales bacterium]